MKVLNREDYQEIRSWIHRNARQLELSVWNYFFENGSREAVIDALSYYQNEDGGFGNAVEPDVWNPESSPYATMVVTGILRRTGAADEMGAGHPMMQGIFRYLGSGAGSDEDGWLHTGDLVSFDDEHFITITGRRKNIILLPNGENVSPEEIEDLFYQSPMVRDCLVREDIMGGHAVLAIEILPVA